MALLGMRKMRLSLKQSMVSQLVSGIAGFYTEVFLTPNFTLVTTVPYCFPTLLFTTQAKSSHLLALP